MPTVACQIDLSGLQARFAALEKIPYFYKPFQAISKLIAASAKDNFAGAHDPEGVPWKPLKSPRRKRSTKKNKKGQRIAASHPLIDTGRLFASVGAGVDHVEKIGALELEVGTNVQYAIYHQEGTRTIPARPFLGFNAALLDQIDDVIGKWIEKQLGL